MSSVLFGDLPDNRCRTGADPIFGALLSAQWVYLLDPLVLMFRGVTVGVYPTLAALTGTV